MNTIFRVSAFFVALITIALWFFGGFNVGRTQTVVAIEHTGTDGGKFIVQEARFLPGSDFLAIGLSVSAALFAAGVLCRRSRASAAPL